MTVTGGTQRELFERSDQPLVHESAASLREELRSFRDFGTATRELTSEWSAGDASHSAAVFVNEFWTSKQRAACSLHEISYRACFKPQLPRFFIERLTSSGDLVYDPFMGRGTTVLETALQGRVPVGCDINPLSRVLVEPRLAPPRLEDIQRRLAEIDFSWAGERPEELEVFYHPETLGEICALRSYLGARAASGDLDEVDRWIRMVAVNRLTGHSPGFFSVYTLPPNQAVSVESQRRINARRDQEPPRRDVPALIFAKSRSLLSGCTPALRETLRATGDRAQLLTGSAGATPEIADGSVALVVTSPPFLDVVQYAQDNWLRCWFCGIDIDGVEIAIHRKVDSWQAAMQQVFLELARVLAPGGYVAFEVGEVRGGKVKLEDAVVPCGIGAGLEPQLVLINDQKFTKTANCWGISNNSKGTNTNRIALFQKPTS